MPSSSLTGIGVLFEYRHAMAVTAISERRHTQGCIRPPDEGFFSDRHERHPWAGAEKLSQGAPFAARQAQPHRRHHRLECADIAGACSDRFLRVEDREMGRGRGIHSENSSHYIFYSTIPENPKIIASAVTSLKILKYFNLFSEYKELRNRTTKKQQRIYGASDLFLFYGKIVCRIETAISTMR